MEMLLDIIYSINRFLSWLLSDDADTILARLVALLTLVGFTWKVTDWNRKRKKDKAKLDKQKEEELKRIKALEDLHPYFSKSSVQKVKDLFIETHGQNISPSKADEPSSYKEEDKPQPLIPQFLNWAFESPGSDNQFHLILADSGMGKTTFMINLYLSYIANTKGEGFSIRLFPLNYPNIEREIKRLISAGAHRSTILLLDAFDEDEKAYPNYVDRIDELVNLTHEFRKIVITCKTQMFPNEYEVPGELKIPKPGTVKPSFHEFNTMYISPFNDGDIQTYLLKKFPDSTDENLKIAVEVVRRATSLMRRPGLLSQIDIFLQKPLPKSDIYKSYQIYEVLIQKWLEREAGRKQKSDRIQFVNEMNNLLEVVSDFLLTKWIEEKRIFLTSEELTPFIKTYSETLTEHDIRSKSILNRDLAGNIKFSHKSILAYYFSKKIRDYPTLQKIFLGFNSWKILKHFLIEYGFIYPEMVWVEGNKHTENNDLVRKEEPLSIESFLIGKYPVTQKLWEMVMKANHRKDSRPSYFEAQPDCPVENISWEEMVIFCNELSVKTGLEPAYCYEKIFSFPGENTEIYKWVLKDSPEGYRIISQEEWEYAAKGGILSKDFIYAGSNNLTEVGWYSENIGNISSTKNVGQKIPNELGIFDLSGNVWERCDYLNHYTKDQNFYQERYKQHLESQQSKAPEEREQYDINFRFRLKGGSFREDVEKCKLIYEDILVDENYRSEYCGFRLARNKKEEYS